MAVSTKPTEYRTQDLVAVVGAMAGVYLNNPENELMVRTAITDAQQEICGMRRWKWLTSIGTFAYSTNSTINMASVSGGKFRFWAGFTWMRRGQDQLIREQTGSFLNRQRIGVSTASYPESYWRFGSTSFLWWPVPSQSDSVSFGFLKQPGQVYTQGDIIIPTMSQLPVLAHMARRKVWEYKGDPRLQQPDESIVTGIRNMIAADTGAGADEPDFRYWYAGPRRPVDLKHRFSGFDSAGIHP